MLLPVFLFYHLFLDVWQIRSPLLSDQALDTFDVMAISPSWGIVVDK